MLSRDHIGINGPEMWVQEAIFGHRYIEEQKAFMLVLEVLAIARVLQVDDLGNQHNNIRVFDHPRSEGEHEQINIAVIRSKALRYILFKDSSLDQVLRDATILPNERMRAWVTKLDEGYKSSVRGEPQAFGYLIERFEDRFEDVAQAIRILRGLELESIHNRRWTSRFLAPRGANLNLSDVDEKFSADRRFFGRGGEMVYLMLSRSKQSQELGAKVADQFLGQSDPLDKVARALTPPPPLDVSGGGLIGYLPLATHPIYDKMAEDWLSVLSLSELPTPQKLEPLFRITALNLVRYFSERSHEVTGRERLDPLPLDVTGGAFSDLRELSKSYLSRMRKMMDEATETFIRQTLEKSPEWQQALKHHDIRQKTTLARSAIATAFSYKKADSLDASSDPSQILSQFISRARNRSRNNISTLVEPLGRQAGFVDARRKVGSWFSGTDEMLEALVLARVKTPLTISDFLKDLYERYEIVVGPREAKLAFSSPPCDISSFEENVKVFERRLTGLGYVKRLSDDCAFVSNPYTQEQN